MTRDGKWSVLQVLCLIVTVAESLRLQCGGDIGSSYRELRSNALDFEFQVWTRGGFLSVSDQELRQQSF